MIEIQCTSCHTRYRIDERVLPADSPTFKCSRCGHVFTTDPLTAKKVGAEPSARVQAARVSTPRSNPKPPVAPPEPSNPEAPGDAPKSAGSDEQNSLAKPSSEQEPKPAPIRPYIRNPRPTVFDRTPEPPPPKPEAQPAAAVDASAVARMKASLEAAKPGTDVESPRRAPEPPQRWPGPSGVVEDTATDDTGENLEFDFSDERAPEFGLESAEPDPAEEDALSSPQRWSVGDDTPETPVARQARFGSGELDPEFSHREPAPIGHGTIARYAAIAPIHPPLPDERAYLERTELHSARSFLGLFLIMGVVFLGLTGIIHGIPSASAELMRRMPVIGPEFVETAPLENLVHISDVQSNYQIAKGGHEALMVTGVVKNNADVPFHTVQVGVRLLDAAQHDLASSAVYCGTTLSPRMIGEMTPHELEFLQKLEPQKAFVLEPGHSAPFLMVFIDPPGNLKHFAVTVAKALPPPAGPQANARP